MFVSNCCDTHPPHGMGQTYFVFIIRIMFDNSMSQRIPIRRHRFIPWILPVVKDLVDYLGHDLGAHVGPVPSMQCQCLWLGQGDTAMLAKDASKGDSPWCHQADNSSKQAYCEEEEGSRTSWGRHDERGRGGERRRAAGGLP